jgi:hypothetical protein
VNFIDERYVRLYVRDTATWLALSFDGQALLCLLLRKADRAGVIDLGARGRASIPLVLGHRADATRILGGLGELEAGGVVEITEDDRTLTFPNFLEAQEARQSDAQRKRESRERRKMKGLVRDQSSGKDQWSPEVTKRDGRSRNVTEGHEKSQQVTTGHSFRAVPSVPSKESGRSRNVTSGSERAANPDPDAPPSGRRSSADGGANGAEPTPADGRVREARDRLCTAHEAVTGRKYRWEGARDSSALKRLLTAAEADELEALWRHGLGLPDGAFPSIATVAQLDQHFATLRKRASTMGTTGIRWGTPQ